MGVDYNAYSTNDEIGLNLWSPQSLENPARDAYRLEVGELSLEWNHGVSRVRAGNVCEGWD